MLFCKILKELRTARSLTQKELAQELKYSQSVISDWEKGATQPTAQAIIALAEFFDVTTDYLLGVYTEEQYSVKHQPSADEQALLHAYRAMPKGKKQALFGMLDIDTKI